MPPPCSKLPIRAISTFAFSLEYPRWASTYVTSLRLGSWIGGTPGGVFLEVEVELGSVEPIDSFETS